MKNTAKYLIPALLFLPAVAFSQDLNPTVEVSRQYRGALMDVDKPSLEMALPDSVQRFNLEFDYSVFDNPFRGAYEFRPFLMDMDLAPGDSGERTLYLRAGAGYTLHPTLDFVWSPLKGDRFRLSLYAKHRSYVGKYRSLAPDMSAPVASVSPDGGRFSGYDLLSEAGVDGSYDWNKGLFRFQAGYYGTALKDTLVKRAYDGVDLKLGVSSKERIESHFVYDVEARYRYAEDKASYQMLPSAGRLCLTEHDFSLDASLGGMFTSGHSIMLDAGVDFASYGGLYASDAGNISFTPRYVFSNSRWDVNLGVKLAFLLRNNREGLLHPMNTARGQVVYPDIRIDFTVIRKYLDLYLTAGGGPDINAYSSLLERNRHVSPLYNVYMDGVPGTGPLLDNTVERVSAALGIEGNIASRLRYDLRAGYRNFANAPFWTGLLLEDSGVSRLAPGLGYTHCQMFFTRLDFSWTSQDVRVGGWMQYLATDLAGRGAQVFSPAPFSGYADIVYNWKGRIFAGVDCAFATERRGNLLTLSGVPSIQARIPGYADLGVTLEYAFTRKFSFWLRGGNLLDMTVQRTPLYAESGIYFTAGICLNL